MTKVTTNFLVTEVTYVLAATFINTVKFVCESYQFSFLLLLRMPEVFGFVDTSYLVWAHTVT